MTYIDELQKAKTANSDIYFKKHLYFLANCIAISKILKYNKYKQ